MGLMDLREAKALVLGALELVVVESRHESSMYGMASNWLVLDPV